MFPREQVILSFTEQDRWLSNFWEFPNFVSPIDGMRYASVEHGYQAAKLDSYHYKLQIQECPTPGHAKRMGRMAEAHVHPSWERRKVMVMHACLRRKFEPGRGTDLPERLIATGRAELIEGNTHGDIFWGRRLTATGHVGAGRNMLGMLLMEVRAELNGGPKRQLIW